MSCREPAKPCAMTTAGAFALPSALVDRCRCLADLELCDGKAGAFTFELPNSGADAHNADSSRNVASLGW